MARIRTIKPEFWLSEDLAECSESSRLLAIGLLNMADDEGYFKAHPLLIKAAIFPFNEPSMSIQDMLTQLSSAGYIELLRGSDGKQYGVITNFEKHQRVNRPTASKIKDIGLFTDSSMSVHGELTPGKEGKGKEQGKEQGKELIGSTSDEAEPNRKLVAVSSSDYPQEFEWLWDNRPRREGADPKKSAYKAAKARLKQGATWREMAEGMLRYKTYCETRGLVNTSSTQRMATFFGPDEHFKQAWTVIEGGSNGSHHKAPAISAEDMADTSWIDDPDMQAFLRKHGVPSEQDTGGPEGDEECLEAGFYDQRRIGSN